VDAACVPYRVFHPEEVCLEADPDSLGDRERSIADSIAAADRVKKEMAQMQNENEKLMVQAREERSTMLKEAKQMSEQIVAKAKEDTRVIADKMITDAQQQIQQQKMAAMTDVKNQIGSLAVQVAEKVLRQQLSTEAAHKRLQQSPDRASET
jgi:F-type H+-transporting ATPase subunit b